MDFAKIQRIVAENPFTLFLILVLLILADEPRGRRAKKAQKSTGK